MRNPRVIPTSLFWIGLLTLVRPLFGVLAFALLIVSVYLAYKDGRRRAAGDRRMAAGLRATIDANSAEVVADAA